MTGVGPEGRPLTAKERKAIADLQKLADRWPKSLTLFSWSGSLVIFKTDEWEARGFEYEDANDYTVDHINGIPNDGGDP
jgi:hypothetical protein